MGLATLNLALPVLPIAVERMTGRTGATGIVTAGVALFTVVFELVAARLVGRLRPSLLLIGAVGLEMVAMAGFATVQSLPAMLLFGCLVGAGFGTVATVSAALIGALAPPGRQGEAIGYYGLAASAPAIIGPPGALLLLSTHGLPAVFWSGTAACTLAAIAAAWVRPAGETPAGRPAAAPPRPPWSRRLVLVWTSFVCVTFTYGAVLSFSPFVLPTFGPGSAAVFLFVFSVTRAVARVGSGRAFDGLADHRLVLPGLAAGAAGLTLLALRSPALTVLAALLYGTAFGTVQTGTFVGMLRSTAGAEPSLVGGLWNVAVDAGIGLGALTLAPVAAVVGFPRMFWMLPVLLAVSFAIRLAALRAGGAVARPSAGG